MIHTVPLGSKIESQHTCVACGCVFRYPLERVAKLHSGANSALAASAEMERQRMTTHLQYHPEDGVEEHPCPTCGLIQPDMTSGGKAMHVAGAALAAAAFIGLLLAWAFGSRPAVELTLLGVGVFVAVAVTQIAGILASPNWRRRANLTRAEKEVASGHLRQVRPGSDGAAPVSSAGRPVQRLLALLLVIVAPAAFLGSIIYEANHSPPTNPGLEPTIVCPGDTVKCPLTDLSIEGAADGQYWRGQPTVRVLNAAEIGGPETLDAKGSDRIWGHLADPQRPDHSLNAPLTPTIQLTVPDDDDLGGQTLLLEVKMKMSYAYLSYDQSSSTVLTSTETKTVSKVVTVRLAPAGYNESTQLAFLIGLGGAAVSVLGGAWLAALACRRVMTGEIIFPILDAPSTVAQLPIDRGAWM
jgi:hypothetical protein